MPRFNISVEPWAGDDEPVTPRLDWFWSVEDRRGGIAAWGMAATEDAAWAVATAAAGAADGRVLHYH